MSLRGGGGGGGGGREAGAEQDPENYTGGRGELSYIAITLSLQSDVFLQAADTQNPRQTNREFILNLDERELVEEQVRKLSF